MKIIKAAAILSVCGMMLLGTACSSTSGEKKEITILAAASMKDALEEIKTKYPEKDVTINYSYGASGTLQTQIEQGAPADIFISASNKQMDALEKKEKIDTDSEVVLLKNDLVFITAKDNDTVKAIEDMTSKGIKKVALGEFSSVPAGQYAQEALTSLHMLKAVEEKAVYASDVRGVLNWVENKEADCGVVYGSDAASSDKVRVVASFPANSHKEIAYPMALIKDSKQSETAKAFMKYLQGDEAKKVFKENGFQVE